MPTLPKLHPVALVSRRKDKWPSRVEATKHLTKNRHYAAMDKTVLARALKHDLRDVYLKEPKKLGALGALPADYITLTTPKAMEACSWSRPDLPLFGPPDCYYAAICHAHVIFVLGLYPDASVISCLWSGCKELRKLRNGTTGSLRNLSYNRIGVVQVHILTSYMVS